MNDPKELAKATNKIIYEIQDYSGGNVQTMDVSWEVKNLNGIEILTPKINVIYMNEKR